METIKECLDYIYSFINLEKKFGISNVNKEYSLDNIEKILEVFDNPQNAFKIIHIAGTKGKGSTTLMVSKLLMLLGSSVCSFLSPHLVKPNERILYNLSEISDSDLIRITSYIKLIIEKNNLIPTTFELFFVIYLLYAKGKNVNYLVIETGLGGRLDCTNVVKPLVSVITPISFDHMEILGNTIEKIASEKAGIIKSNSKVVVSKQAYDCENIFIKKAKDLNSIYYYTPEIINIKKIKYFTNSLEFNLKLSISCKNYLVKNLNMNLYGEHQIDNFCSAILTVYLIDKNILKYIENNYQFKIEIPGRIQVFRENPILIIDVAHNGDSAKKLVETLKSHFGKNEKWTILSSMAKDKDYESFYNELKKICKEMIITSLNSYKDADSLELYNNVKKIIPDCQFIINQEEAFEEILSKNSRVLITGSFYLSGPFIEYVEKNR